MLGENSAGILQSESTNVNTYNQNLMEISTVVRTSIASARVVFQFLICFQLFWFWLLSPHSATQSTVHSLWHATVRCPSVCAVIRWVKVQCTVCSAVSERDRSQRDIYKNTLVILVRSPQLAILQTLYLSKGQHRLSTAWAVRQPLFSLLSPFPSLPLSALFKRSL